MKATDRTNSSPDLVTVEGLTKIYSSRRGLLGREVKVTALREVDLSIAKGETFGLVGETGSGKSTLGRLVLGLERPTRGTVKFEGVPIADRSRKDMRLLRRRMQVVFQDPYESLNPYMTARQILEEPFRVQRMYDTVSTPRRVRELAEQVGLPNSALDRSATEFSGGQRQRIAIARALCLGTEFLVADEPTAALDVSIQAQILNLLLDLQVDRGMALLLISHNLAVVRHMSERLGVMYGGRIVETGDSEDVYEAPKHPYTLALLSAIPYADPRAERARTRIQIRGDAPDPTKLPSGCPFRSRCWLAIERCRTEVPKLRPVGGDGQMAACHRAEEVGHETAKAAAGGHV